MSIKLSYDRRTAGARRSRDRGSRRFAFAAGVGALLTYCLGGVVVAPATASVTTHLSQLSGMAACTSPTAGQSCADGVALVGANSATVSPDGRSAYVASGISDAVAVFDRAANGTLTQKAGLAGCISNTGAGPCVDGTALDGASSVTVSPDGASVYVSSHSSDAVAVFNRSAIGTLTQKPGRQGCISEIEINSCVTGSALDGAASVTVSPDGASVYVASQIASAVAVFDRALDGSLTQKPDVAGCVSRSWAGHDCTVGEPLDGAASVTVSPDGTNAYVASTIGVAVLDRATDGTLTQRRSKGVCIGSGRLCVGARGLHGARSVAVSPDARNVYVASAASDAIAVLDRGARGTLSQKPGTAGCISNTGARPCADGTALDGASSVTVSPDGHNAYVAALSGAVVMFDRAADGSLSQRPGSAGCISETGVGLCADGTALGGAASVTITPDGHNVYVAAAKSDAVAAFTRFESLGAPCPPEICIIEDPAGPPPTESS